MFITSGSQNSWLFTGEFLGIVYSGSHMSLFPPYGARGAAFVRRRQKSEEAMGVEGEDWQKKQVTAISNSASPHIFYFDIIQH